MEKQFTVISTFAGTGGSSLGYKLAGFRELLALDWEPHAVECFKLNFPEVPCWQKDITRVSAKEILEFCKINPGDLDVFDGSPPCQGFSIAGKRDVADPRNDLFNYYVRLITELQPKVFVMENVSGMIKGTFKGKFNEIMEVLKATTYNVKCKLMNAKYYNVPQSRERLIFIGTRKDLNISPSYPIPNNDIITSKQTLGNIKSLGIIKKIENRKILERFNKVKPGKNFAMEAKINQNYFNMKKMDFKKPILTITKTPNIVHPTEKRYLSINECKLLCSFPENWQLGNNFNKAWNRLGNAVMPNMMRAIAENIRDNILIPWYNKP